MLDLTRYLSFARFLIFVLVLAFSFTDNNAAARAQEPGDDEVVRVNTDLVVVNVTVTDSSGKFARGLKRSDFRLKEDGKDQSIASFGAAETPFAAVVLLDFSGSMEKRLSLARSAAIRFLDGLREDDVAAVYRFHSDIEILQDFSPSRDLAPIAFGMSARGMTVLNDAILRASEELAQRPEQRRAIVVLSDGLDTRSGATQDKALAAALRAGVTIYAVDMVSLESSTPQVRAQAAAALRSYANKSGGRYISTPGGQALREAFTGIAEELGNQYTLTYRPTNRTRDGAWRAINVELSKPELTPRTRKGYRAPKS